VDACFERLEQSNKVATDKVLADFQAIASSNQEMVAKQMAESVGAYEQQRQQWVTAEAAAALNAESNVRQESAAAYLKLQNSKTITAVNTHGNRTSDQSWRRTCICYSKTSWRSGSRRSSRPSLNRWVTPSHFFFRRRGPPTPPLPFFSIPFLSKNTLFSGYVFYFYRKNASFLAFLVPRKTCSRSRVRVSVCMCV
jgi:hypothetical protein